MTFTEVSAFLSAVLSIGAIVAWLIARGKSSRAAESQALLVAFEATDKVVNLVNAQLTRSITDFVTLSNRLDIVEKALADEQGKTLSLSLQLGKMRKRVSQLEDFIKAQGWTPPPVFED